LFKTKGPTQSSFISFFLHRICSIKKEDPLKVSFFLHRICSILEELTQAFLLSSLDFFKKKEDPLKVSFFLHRICSILEERTQAFVLLLHQICSKRKKTHSSIPFYSPDLFSAPAAASIPQVTPPTNYTENLRLQSQNLS
jgi:hypothetical protein